MPCHWRRARQESRSATRPDQRRTSLSRDRPWARSVSCGWLDPREAGMTSKSVRRMLGSATRWNTPMLLGHPVGELLWLAAAIAVAGVATGFFAGLFGVGGGAVIVPVLYEVFRILEVPEAVRMQLCVGTSLAIIVPTSIRSYRAHGTTGARHPGPGADLDRADRGRSRGRRADRRLCIRGRAQDRIRDHRGADGHQAAGQPHELGGGLDIAGCRTDARLWLRHRVGVLPDGRRGRLAVDHGADAVWPAGAQCDRHVRGRRRADHHRRRDRLHAGRSAASGVVAAAVDRLRLDHRPGSDGADLHPGRAGRSACGAYPDQAAARSGACHFPAGGGGAFPGQPDSPRRTDRAKLERA